MKNKKISLHVLVFLSLFLFLVSCGKKEETTSKKTTQSTKAQKKAPDKKEFEFYPDDFDVEIRFKAGKNGKGNAEVLIPLVERRVKEILDAKENLYYTVFNTKTEKEYDTTPLIDFKAIKKDSKYDSTPYDPAKDGYVSYESFTAYDIPIKEWESGQIDLMIKTEKSGDVTQYTSINDFKSRRPQFSN